MCTFTPNSQHITVINACKRLQLAKLSCLPQLEGLHLSCICLSACFAWNENLCSLLLHNMQPHLIIISSSFSHLQKKSLFYRTTPKQDLCASIDGQLKVPPLPALGALGVSQNCYTSGVHIISKSKLETKI